MGFNLTTSDGRKIPVFPILPAEIVTDEQFFLQKCSKAFGCALEKVLNTFIMENPVELTGVAFEEYVIAAGSEPCEIAISDPLYIDKQSCLRSKYCFRLLELSLFFGATSTESNTHLTDLFPLSPEHAEEYTDLLAPSLKAAKPYHPIPLVAGDRSICRWPPLLELQAFGTLLLASANAFPVARLGSVLGLLEHLAYRRVLQILPQTYSLASLRLIQAVNGITRYV